MIADLRLAARSLRHSPGFTAAAVVTLALGIAAINTVFTLIDAVLLRPMPFDDPQRVIDLGEAAYLDMQEWRDRSRTLEQIAGVDTTAMSVADSRSGAERYPGAYVSANAFALIGHEPHVGRGFHTDDDRPGAASVAIISHGIWKTRYGSSRDAIGRTVRINGAPTTIIGVMPESFAFPQVSALWMPLAQHPGVQADPQHTVVDAIGRLERGATVEQAGTELVSLVRRQMREQPDRERHGFTPLGLYRAGVGANTPVARAFTIMMGAVAFVLLIACANVANLMLVRAASRARDVSVRISLGAGRWAILRHFLAESVLLTVVAAGVAFGLSLMAIRFAVARIMETGDAPYWLDFSVNARIFLFFTAVCAVTSALSGLAPAWVTATGKLTEVLGAWGRAVAGTRQRRRWTSAFVVGQLTLALVLLIGTGVMVRSLLAQLNTDSGVDTSQLVVARVELPSRRYATVERRRDFYRGLEEQVSSMPQARAAFASAIPLGGAPDRKLVTDLDPDAPADRRPEVGHLFVSADYFDALGARVVRGRAFRRGETERAAVVNERLAALYFGNTEPVGRRLKLLQGRGPEDATAEWLTIVGIAPDIRQESTEGGAFDPIVYLPYAVSPPSGIWVVARSAAGPAAVAESLRAQMRTLDADVPVFDVSTADDRLGADRWGQRFATSLFAVFTAIALLLAVIGLYAVTAYAATERTREIGVRIALGAGPSHVAWLVTRRAAIQLCIGLVLGTAGGVAVARILPSELAGVTGAEPLTFVVVALVLIAAGLAASALPAHRAMRLDPVRALGAE